MTEEQTKGVLGFIYAAFPREKASGQTVAVFVAGLADMEADCVKQAAMEWVRDHRFPPSLAELRSRAKDLQDSRRGVAQGQQAAALPPGTSNLAKHQAQIANAQAWALGLIDDETRILESARIYAEMSPIPSDGADVMAAAESAVDELRRRREARGGQQTGTMGSALRSVTQRMATRSQPVRFPDPPPEGGTKSHAGPAARQRRQATADGPWWDGN